MKPGFYIKTRLRLRPRKCKHKFMYEVETKVLEVELTAIARKMADLGAEKVQETRLNVDWFREKGKSAGQDLWYLRVRTYSNGKKEVTWKGKSEILGSSRKHKEINFTVSDAEAAADLFLELGLEKYAHQEKDRISWTLKDWRFDLDQYPKMPAYLEIEGKDENHIQEAVELLGLQGHKTSPEGEKVLIETEYKLNWHKMEF